MTVRHLLTAVSLLAFFVLCCGSICKRVQRNITLP